MRTGNTAVALTRFGVPRVPNATVPRESLVGRLDAATDCALSLVVAAPGSGKTALLIQWVERLDGPVAWLSCDPTDADPGRFWPNVATAVASTWTDIGPTVAELAESDSSDHLAVGLANALATLGRPGVIVIDDFHLAGTEPTLMKAFVDALPAHVRLVLGSRSDPPFPVGRLRLQGRLLELRQADLRFTSAEARALLTTLGVHTDDAELDAIVAITEGWTAAVHLAGLWLRAQPDPAGLVRGLVETDHSLVDFLMNEVIDLQPSEVVEFLMVTAELETFDTALTDAVRDRHDAVEMLARIRAANLFLVEPERAGGWYRYHHLFAEFLRGRLRTADPDRAPAIHRAAAGAYSRRDDLMSAVEHSMRAGDTEGAVARLEAYASGNYSLEDRGAGVATVRAWLDENGMSQLERSPSSVLTCAIMLSGVGRSDDAARWLRLIEAREDALDHEGRVLLQGAWGFHHLVCGDPVAALDRVAVAWAELHEAPVLSAWALAIPNVAIQAQLWLDDLDAAADSIDALRVGPIQPPVVSDVRVPGFASHLQALRGDLGEAERSATNALDAADLIRLHPANFGRAEPHLALAMVALEHDRLEVADLHLDELLRIVEAGRRPQLEVLAQLQLALVASARGDGDDAADAIERARAVLPDAKAPVRSRIDQTALRIALDRGDQPTARTLRARLPPSPESALLAARARLAADDFPGARDVLAAMAQPASHRRVQVEHGLLSALALAGSEPALAAAVLHRSLTIAEPAGFHRTFVAEGAPLWNLLESLPAHGGIASYRATLLTAARRVVPPSRAPTMAAARDDLIDPLSERELTVLRYLASRLTCTEIARELYLSVNTVRSHVKAIYRKLGVNSRADAVARAHALRLSHSPTPG